MYRHKQVVFPLHGSLLFLPYSIWALLGAAILALSFAYYQVAYFIVTAAAVWLFCYLWTRKTLARVKVEETLDAYRAFPGESIGARLRLHNDKLLPVPWLEMVRPKTGGMLPAADSPYRPGEQGWHCRASWLLGYQQATWEHSYLATRRGCYRVEPQALRGGDPFGFFYRKHVLNGRSSEVVIYPRLFDLEDLGITWKDPLGEKRAPDFLYADPLLVAGVRDYQPGDSLRRINWVASARALQLKSNLWEGTVEVRSLIFLEVSSLLAQQWGEGKKDLAFELLASAAASLAASMAEQRLEVGLVSDLPVAGLGRPVFLLPAPNRGQAALTAILDTLARMERTLTTYQPDRLQQEVHLPPRASVIALTACWNEQLASSWGKAWPQQHISWLALNGMPASCPPGLEVSPLFPGWEENSSLRELVLGGEPQA